MSQYENGASRSIVTRSRALAAVLAILGSLVIGVLAGHAQAPGYRAEYDINADGTLDMADVEALAAYVGSNYGAARGEAPTPTPTVIAEPTHEPATPAPGASATPAPVAGEFGNFPDCVNGAVPMESHAWWHEDGERAPRHLHMAACLPNNREGAPLVAPDEFTVNVRTTLYNTPARLEWVRWQWQGNTGQQVDMGNVQCQERPDEFRECTYWTTLTITAKGKRYAQDELRISPNLRHEALGTRQYTTLNAQILTRTGSGRYRPTAAPIGRGWYQGANYINARWQNYTSLFEGGESIPTVRGTIQMEVVHRQCTEDDPTSAAYVDPAFHAHHAGQAPAPQPLYFRTGCYRGTVALDTTKLSNGVHIIYLQSTERDSRGLNAGALAYRIRVDN